MFGTVGRLSPRLFVAAIVVVYLLSFFAQQLLAGGVTAALGYGPFIAGQAVLIAAWFVLHAGRLRDAGQPPGLALGIALLYALAMVLTLLLVAAMTPPFTLQSAPPPRALQFVDLFGPIGLMIIQFDQSAFGVLGYGFLFVALVPIVVAIAFSIWTATRKSIVQ